MYCKPEEKEGVLKNERNGRHRETPNQASTFVARGGNRQARLSSMFPFPLFLSPLCLPIPGLLSSTTLNILSNKTPDMLGYEV